MFLTGANGWIGSLVARDLIEAGHSVVGLVRSREKGEALAAVGGTPLLGSLGNLDAIRNGAENADGIIHTAFGIDLSRIAELAEEERVAIETFGEIFRGSSRPIIVTGGFGLLNAGDCFDESRGRLSSPAFPAHRNKRRSRLPNVVCTSAWSATPARCMGRENVMASSPCWPP